MNENLLIPLADKLIEKLNSDPEFLKAIKGWQASILIEILPFDESSPRILRVLITIDGKLKDIRIANEGDIEIADFLIKIKEIDELIDINTFYKLLSGKMNRATLLRLFNRFLRFYLEGKIRIQGKISELMEYGRKIWKPLLRNVVEVFHAETLDDLIEKIQSDPKYTISFTKIIRRNEFLTPHVILGKNSREFLTGLKGKKALIVTDKKMVELGFAKEVKRVLEYGNIEVKIYDEVQPEPPLSIIEKGAKIARRWRPNYIIGLGGGSSMDTAKAIYLKYLMPKISIKAVMPIVKIRARRTKLILIPTTSGTGSEATWAAVLTEEWLEGKRKTEIASRDFIPDYAILDPYFVEKLPKSLVISTGLDVLAHALEAYMSVWFNEITDALAIHAIRLVFEYLPLSCEGDLKAREKMHYAATIAGMAFGNSQATLAHGLGHALGSEFNIPHGLAVAVFLPYAYDYYKENIEDRLAKLSDYLGIGLNYNSYKDKIEALRDKIIELYDRVRAPMRIIDLGIDREFFEEKLDKLIGNAFRDACTGAGPRVPTKEDLRKLLIYTYEGKRVDF